MKTKQEFGLIGEKLAVNILNSLGFKQVIDLLDSDNRVTSYDVLVVRWSQKYAINVKYSDNTFTINYRNLERLNDVYKKHGYKPAYLFIKPNGDYFFYSLDDSFPKNIDLKNRKMESFD